MRRLVTPTFLAIAGAVAAAIGAAILFAPHSFFAANHIMLGTDPNLMSEIRAPGGLLLVAGVFVIAGAFISRLTRVSLMVAAIGFGAYGASRLVSVALDGVPSSALLSAMVVELVLALLALVLIIGQQRRTASNVKGYVS
ncbi:MAG: DUF4345 domain-containing protein [Pseudomonadota bacterium]